MSPANKYFQANFLKANSDVPCPLSPLSRPVSSDRIKLSIWVSIEFKLPAADTADTSKWNRMEVGLGLSLDMDVGMGMGRGHEMEGTGLRLDGS